MTTSPRPFSEEPILMLMFSLWTCTLSGTRVVLIPFMLVLQLCGCFGPLMFVGDRSLNTYILSSWLLHHQLGGTSWLAGFYLLFFFFFFFDAAAMLLCSLAGCCGWRVLRSVSQFLYMLGDLNAYFVNLFSASHWSRMTLLVVSQRTQGRLVWLLACCLILNRMLLMKERLQGIHLSWLKLYQLWLACYLSGFTCLMMLVPVLKKFAARLLPWGDAKPSGSGYLCRPSLYSCDAICVRARCSVKKIKNFKKA